VHTALITHRLNVYDTLRTTTVVITNLGALAATREDHGSGAILMFETSNALIASKLKSSIDMVI
jgi:hypothetical protein